MLNDQNLLYCINYGDIIAVVTSMKGLGIVHVGFAVWINEKLHLLHASSLKKKAFLDTKTLFECSLENRSNLGIRVFR
jgi:hypothetical protein